MTHTYVYGRTENCREFLYCIVAVLQIAATYTAVVGLSVETKEKWKWWILTCMVCFVGFLVGVLCLLPVSRAFRFTIHLYGILYKLK